MKTHKLSRIDPKALLANPRCTFAAWKKFEPLVIAAMANHPRPYTYSPANMTPSSVSSRLREAIRGKLAFDHSSELSLSDVESWYSQIIVKHDNTQVYIGTPEAIQSVLKGEAVSGAQRADSYVYPTLSFEQISAFQLLLSSNLISGPVICQAPPDTSLLPERPNVELMIKPDGSLILI